MNNPAELSDGALWHFSLAVYGREGVEEACLRLQDTYGLDVNLLLFCLWAGSRGQRVEAGAMAALISAAAAWQAEVVAPLRGARRWLKSQAITSDPSAEVLRQAIKTRELEAEAVEQRFLESRLSPAPQAPSPEAAAANLLSYLKVRSLELNSEIKALLIRMLSRSFDHLSEQKAGLVLAAVAAQS